MKPSGEPPKTLMRCRLVREKPYLDGLLDDAAWEDAPSLPIAHSGASSGAGAGNDPGAVAHLARDDEYLYFAVRCRKAPGIDYSVNSEPRTYDAPLTDRDRVDLLIDLDRDYSTFYRLTVDHRGWTGEACLENGSWNPQWYVAAARDEAMWTVEAAIPLRELTPHSPRRREAWAAGVVRIVPHAVSASAEASQEHRARPERIGLLLFE
jgi:hypothetical protein